MNKTCCICKKIFRLPFETSAENGGFGTEGKRPVKEIVLKYTFSMTASSGFICPACVFEQFSEIIQMRRKDIDSLLAGRNYNIEMDDPEYP